ncbi:reverse transcriptase [Phytophthora megakarya]|uniref:Reverse transcriptase n=1 Tax=Phytophthora megakarya TaxID=4795 RepID=A0A225UMW0_9STRA|nr:reverse transcriptase [Phytophthora megakarya]
MRAERLERNLREREPPCTQTQRYQWPTKLLMRPQSQATEEKMVKLQEKPKPLDMTLKIIGNSVVVLDTVARDPEEPDTRPELIEQTHPDLSSKVETLDPESMADVEDNAQSQTNCSIPVQRLEAEYARVMRVPAEELDLEPAVYLREGSYLMAQLRDQLIMLPEMEGLAPECNIDEANVGVSGVTTPEMEAKLQPPARGVVCDIDVGESKPVALHARQIAASFLVKVFELLKKMLEAELIEHSESEWSSPIVIVLKKNGIDIRMCIDYRLLNLLFKLSRYPLPLIDDLLVDFKSAMGFLSLDMASGFWANTPLIYQSIINNCLWGFVRLPPEEEAMVDPEVLEFLDLESQETLKPEVDMKASEIPSLDMTVFRRNIPAPLQMGPVLGRSSYIDDFCGVAILS